MATGGLVLVGLYFGFAGGNIQARTDWIVGLLYGSYVAANVLKWVWWRFNGWGYFSGMAAGMLGVALLPAVTEALGLELLAIEQFPFLLLVAMVGSVVGCLLTPPVEADKLDAFYTRTRPWGFWGPVRERVLAADPAFAVNRDLPRDIFNVVTGIAWQMCLVVVPIFLVIREWASLGWSLAALALTTVLLKRFWRDRLADWPAYCIPNQTNKA